MSAKPFSCAACRSISLICCPLSWGTCSIRTLEGTVDRLRLSKALPKSWRSDGQLSGCGGDWECSLGVASSPACMQPDHFSPLHTLCLLTAFHSMVQHCTPS